MSIHYPQYGFTEEDVHNALVRYIQLDNPMSYPFDSYHSHEYNEFLYFSTGGGVHNINFKEYAIENDSIHLLNAGDLHWLERSIASEGFAIVYKDAFLFKLQQANGDVNYIDYFCKSEVINLTEEEVKKFSLILEEIKQNSENHLYIFNLIGTFFTKLAIEKNDDLVFSKKHVNDITKSFFELIQIHFKERYTLTEYAQLLHLTPAVLERKVKEATGKTVNTLQKEFLLKEAKRMLIQTDAPLKEIADALGFNEVAHFSNWFKKTTNTQPGHYRKDL